MAHYDGNVTMIEQALPRDGDGTAGRDPGDILEEAISLWCYFLKLEADPLAYRYDKKEQVRPRAANPYNPDGGRAGGLRL